MLYIWAGSLIYKFMCVYVWSLTPFFPSHFPSHTYAHNKHTHKYERETQVAEPTCGTCQHPTKLISYLLLLLGDCLCDNPKESREGREGIKSNLAPVTGSILKVISVFVCKSDIKHVGLNMRVCVSAQLLYVTPVKIEFTVFTGMPKLWNTVNMAVAQNVCHPSSALLLFALQLKSLLSLREWVRAFFKATASIYNAGGAIPSALWNKRWRWSSYISIAGDNGIPGHIFMG